MLGGLVVLTSACSGAPSEAERAASPSLEPTPRGATDSRAKLRFALRGRRLTLTYGGPEKRSSTGYALHNSRVRYACYRSLWASVGQDQPRGAGVARARTTKPFERGERRKTVVLDRDLSDQAGACIVESLRAGSRADIAVGMFVSSAEFVRRDAPAAPDVAARAGERLLDGSYGVICGAETGRTGTEAYGSIGLGDRP